MKTSHLLRFISVLLFKFSTLPWVLIVIVWTFGNPAYAGRTQIAPSAKIVKYSGGNSFGDSISCSGPGVIDVDEFETWIHRRLQGNVVGYGFAISEGGVPVGFGHGGYAQLPVLDNNVPFTYDKKIQVASVSKPITAIALLQLMEKLGVGPDDAIGMYLPESWEKGDGFDSSGITFDDLLTHQSGFEQTIAELINKMGDKLPNPNTWEGLQALVANGVSKAAAASGCPTKNDDDTYKLGDAETPEKDHYGVSCYKNANYALARELIWRMALKNGDLDSAFDEKDPLLQPMASATAYQKYVQDYILAPVGVTGSACKASENPSTRSLMYDIEGNVPFQMLTAGGDAYSDDDSDLLECGPYNWSLSALDLIQVMGKLNCGELLSQSSLEIMHERKMGYSRASNSTTYPDRYFHNGRWFQNRSNVKQALWPQHPDHPANDPAASEEDCEFNGTDLVCPAKGSAKNEIHTCVMEFPNNVDVALVMNSSIRNEPDVNACNVLSDAFDKLL